MIRRYTFRLYPNATQAAALEHYRVMACRLYNALIEQRRDAWDRRRISMTKFSQGREMTLLRNDPDCPEWNSFPSAIMERTAERVEQAYKKYFDNVKQWRRGYWDSPFPPKPPHYQKSAEFSGFGYRESPKGWRWLDGKRVRLQGIGDVKLRGRFPFDPEQYRTADILYRNGKWEISIVVKSEKDGLMRSPTQPFSNGKASNSLAKTMEFVSIRCSDPAFAGEAQVQSQFLIAAHRCSDPAFAGEAQAKQSRAISRARCSDPALRHKSRGKKNRNRRQRNAISRRNHAQHELTSYIAAHGGDVEVTRPPIKQATKTGRGDAKEHGAMVKFKAEMNRDLLDRGIGGLCEKLAYKVEARGNAFVVIEQGDHVAMVPEAVASTAKLAKKVRRAKRKTCPTPPPSVIPAV